MAIKWALVFVSSNPLLFLIICMSYYWVVRGTKKMACFQNIWHISIILKCHSEMCCVSHSAPVSRAALITAPVAVDFVSSSARRPFCARRDGAALLFICQLPLPTCPVIKGPLWGLEVGVSCSFCPASYRAAFQTLSKDSGLLLTSHSSRGGTSLIKMPLLGHNLRISWYN